MSQNGTVKERVLRVISEVIEKPITEEDLDQRFVEDWGIDSLLALEILAVMEKEFQIEIPEEELANFVTTRQIIEMTERKMAQASVA